MPAPQRPRRPAGAQRRQRGDDDQEFEPRPRKKTVAMSPMVAVTIFFIVPGVMLVIFLSVYWSKRDAIHAGETGEVIVEDDNKEYEQFKKECREAMKLKKEALRLRTSDDVELFRSKITEAKETIGNLLDKINAITDPVRDPTTHELPPEYSGYEKDYDLLQTAMDDLLKSSPLDW